LKEDAETITPDAYKTLNNQSVCLINGSSKWTGTRTQYSSQMISCMDNKQFIRLSFSDGWNSLVLYINSPFVTGKYYLDKSPHISCYDYSSDHHYAEMQLRQDNDYETFRTDASHTGWIELIFADTAQKIFKGTYMFTGKSISRNYEAKFLNGHFDFHLR
jgi:hypothetical protein